MGIGSLKIKKEEVIEFIPSAPRKMAFVDGDVLAFLSCPPRKHYLDDKTVKVQLDEHGRTLRKEFSIDEEREYLQEAWQNFRRKITEIHEKVYCDEVLVAIGGCGNFRQDLFPEYKVQRRGDNVKPNLTVPVLRELAIAEGLAINKEGFEADDLIRIWASEAKRCGHEYVVCSIDKDLLCITGTHYHPPAHARKEATITIVDEMKAKRFHYTQLLQGDPTDNIPGLPGIGPKKAEKIIAGCETEEEMQTAVVAHYMDYYGDTEWYNTLLINGKLLHILEYEGDYFTIDNWPVYQELCK